MEKGFTLNRVSFEELPGWKNDNPAELLPALRRCHSHVTNHKHYRTGSLGISTAELLRAMDEAETCQPNSAAEARAFFEKHFQPFQILPSAGKSGLVTAFYEPEIEVREEADAEWRFPFYRRPDDLVDLDETSRPKDMDPSYAFGLSEGGHISEYPDRRAIDLGYLDGRGLEIAWARSKEDVFFAHIQGAARLTFPDGRITRITYAAKAGHSFSAIGKLLIERGEIALEDISMASIRAWLRGHPDKADEVYWHNRSYIFFKEVDPGDPQLGPVAAAKVQMTPGRSIAVDRLIHTFSVPFYVSSKSLTHLDGGQPFQRLMLALDTGSAIIGPARGDIFTGTGEVAGALAGSVRNDADFFVFIPKAAAARY